MRLRCLIPLTLCIGLMQFVLRPYLGQLRVDVEWMLLVAFCSSLHLELDDILPMFWWCGFVQDLFLGAHLGSNILLFSLAGLLTALLLPRFRNELLLPRVTLLVALLLLVHAGRVLLVLHTLQPLLEGAFWRGVGGTCLVAVLLAPLLHTLMEKRALRTWREEAHYGLRNV